MNSISNFIGQRLGICPLPATAQAITARMFHNPRDREDPLNQKIADFLEDLTSLDIEGFWNNTLSNDRIFFELIRHVEWDLAEEFYKASPYINLNYAENSPCSSSLSKLMEAIIGLMQGNSWYSEKGDVHKLISLIFETDPTLDLFLTMTFPHKRVLDFLFYNNHINLIDKLIENLMSGENADERALAKKILIAIRDLIEKNKQYDDPPPDEQAILVEDRGLIFWKFPERSARENVLKLWRTYLSLIKETYPKDFSEIKHDSSLDLDLAVKAIDTLVNRLWLPIEVYEKIVCEAVLQGKADLIRHLSPKFQLEPNVSKETLIKLTTLSFLAFEENSKEKLGTEQKKQCFRLINKAILKNGSIFNAEIKERIVREIGQIDHFSKSNIKMALERAFN